MRQQPENVVRAKCGHDCNFVNINIWRDWQCVYSLQGMQSPPDVAGGGRRLLAAVEAVLSAAAGAAPPAYPLQVAAAAPPQQRPQLAEAALAALTPLAALLETGGGGDGDGVDGQMRAVPEADQGTVTGEAQAPAAAAPMEAADASEVLGVDVVLQLHVHLRPRGDAAGSALGSPVRAQEPVERPAELVQAPVLKLGWHC